MANEKAKTDTAGHVWRVNYRFIVNFQLRNQSYIIPAASKEEAIQKAEEILNERFTGTGQKYTITGTKEYID